MNTGELLLRAVLCDPGDDTARLAYADWLGENGGADRAEFVRVQCELAQLRRATTELYDDETDWSRCESVSASWCPNCGDCRCKHAWPDFGPRNDPACPLHSPDSPHASWHDLADRIEKLREREAEVFDPRFLPECGGQLREWYFECYPDSYTPDRPFSFLLVRGFVDEVRLPAAAFTEQFARELFSRHPVTKVVLTDKQPHETGLPVTDNEYPGWMWCCDPTMRQATDSWGVPRYLFDQLGDSILTTFGTVYGARPSKFYAIADYGLAALSAACVARGRSLAGLPPLPHASGGA